MQAELVKRGPLSVVFDASMLQFYHSGVWDPWVCSKTSLDHGVFVCLFVCFVLFVCVRICLFACVFSCTSCWVWH